MTIATLAAVKLLGRSSQSWSLREGVDPVQMVFEVLPSQLSGLLYGGISPVTLVLGREKFENLIILHESPAGNPITRCVTVVDRRWLWDFKSCKLGFNIRRKIGVRRLTAPDSISAPEAQRIAPTIAYATYSLDGGTTPWTAERTLDAVLDLCVKAEVDGWGNKPKINKEPGLDKFLEQFPIENLLIEGTAAEALRQVLSYLHGVGLAIDQAGVIQLYKKSSGGEDAQVTKAGRRKMERGWIQPISLANIRPKKIRVLFTREIEVRWNFREGDTTFGDPDARWLLNVIPVPDYTLTIGTDFAQGTYVEISSILSAWNQTANGGPCPILGALTLEHLRMAFVPFNGIWDAIDLAGEAAPNADWAARAGAAQQCYRATYQINPLWMGRIFQLRAERVGTFDSATGMRAGASVYSDHAYLSTRRTVLANWGQAGPKPYITNIAAFDGGTIGPTTRVAPADVNIVDEDQGVLQVIFLQDKYRVFGPVLPSQVELTSQSTAAGSPVAQIKGSPGADPRFNNITFDMIGPGDASPRLTADYRMAVILTAVPAVGAWEDQDAQFTVVEVSPSDVAEFAGQSDCQGPILDILIGPGYETARIAWSDDEATAIEQAFGVRRGMTPEAVRGTLDELTINLGTSILGQSGGGASLQAIALAAATRVLHSLADRQQGSMTGTSVSGLRPAGWLEEVGYSVESSGEESTMLALPGRLPQLKLEQYLDATTRRVVLKLANPGG